MTPEYIKHYSCLRNFDRIQGLCNVCNQPIYQYDARDAFYFKLTHWDCSARNKAIKIDIEEGEEQQQFQKDLEKFQTPTLISMLSLYDELPNERTEDMIWKVIIIRKEIRSRMGFDV